MEAAGWLPICGCNTPRLNSPLPVQQQHGDGILGDDAGAQVSQIILRL